MLQPCFVNTQLLHYWSRSVGSTACHHHLTEINTQCMWAVWKVDIYHSLDNAKNEFFFFFFNTRKWRLLSRDDLTLPWKPLYQLVKQVFHSKFKILGMKIYSTYVHCRLQDWTVHPDMYSQCGTYSYSNDFILVMLYYWIHTSIGYS